MHQSGAVDVTLETWPLGMKGKTVFFQKNASILQGAKYLRLSSLMITTSEMFLCVDLMLNLYSPSNYGSNEHKFTVDRRPN